MQGILRRQGRELFETARSIGFEGVELDVQSADREQALFSPAGRREMVAAKAATGMAVPSICLGVLNRFGFKMAEPAIRRQAADLIRSALDACPDLGCSVILIPFFGESELFTPDDRQRTAQGLAEVAPLAQEAGVVLAVENTLSAADNIELLKAAGSPAVQVYFDVSNAAWWGHDPAASIRALGRHIAQVHFKDGKGGHSNAMLGQGHVDFPAVAASLHTVGYEGWIVLESAAPHDPVQDAGTNLAFARSLFAA